jgi:hypothetical protein
VFQHIYQNAGKVWFLKHCYVFLVLYLRYTHCKGSAECFNKKNNALAHNSYRTDMEFLATFRSCSGLFGAEIEEVIEAIR